MDCESHTGFWIHNGIVKPVHLCSFRRGTKSGEFRDHIASSAESREPLFWSLNIFVKGGKFQTNYK